MLSRPHVALQEATKLYFCALELQEAATAATAMQPLLYPAGAGGGQLPCKSLQRNSA